MSTQRYRYYNSPAGVGVTVVAATEGEHARIDWRGRRKNPSPWVRAADLYAAPEEARGKPHAQFTATK